MQQTLIFDTTTVVVRSVDTAPLTTPPEKASALLAQKATVEMIVRDLFGPDAKIGHRADGAPYIESRDVYVSISHCSEFVAVAADLYRRVGVDVEMLRERALSRVIERVLMAGEERYADSPQESLRAWTMKEAVFKACSDLGLKTLSETPIPAPDGDGRVDVQGRTMQVYTLSNIGYTGATLSVAIEM